MSEQNANSGVIEKPTFKGGLQRLRDKIRRRLLPNFVEPTVKSEPIASTENSPIANQQLHFREAIQNPSPRELVVFPGNEYVKEYQVKFSSSMLGAMTLKNGEYVPIEPGDACWVGRLQNGEVIGIVADGVSSLPAKALMANELVKSAKNAQSAQAESLVDVIKVAHSRVAAQTEYSGVLAASTATVAGIRQDTADNRLYLSIVSVGDSKAFMMTQDILYSITKDENKSGVGSNQLSNAVISDEDLDIRQIYSDYPESSGEVLICSDGLIKYLGKDDDQVRLKLQRMMNDYSGDDMAGYLTQEVQAEAKRQGRANIDDISAVVIQINAVYNPPVPREGVEPSRG